MNGKGLIARCRARAEAYQEACNALQLHEGDGETQADKDAKEYVAAKLYKKACELTQQASRLEADARKKHLGVWKK